MAITTENALSEPEDFVLEIIDHATVFKHSTRMNLKMIF